MKFNFFRSKKKKSKEDDKQFVQINVRGKVESFTVTEDSTAKDILMQIKETVFNKVHCKTNKILQSAKCVKRHSSKEQELKLQEEQERKEQQENICYIALLVDSTVLALNTHLIHFIHGPVLTLGVSTDSSIFGSNSICTFTLGDSNNKDNNNNNNNNINEKSITDDNNKKIITKCTITPREDSHESSESAAALSSSLQTSEPRSVSCELILKEVEDKVQLEPRVLSQNEAKYTSPQSPYQSHNLIHSNDDYKNKSRELHSYRNKTCIPSSMLHSIISTKSTSCDFTSLHSPISAFPDDVVLSSSPLPTTAQGEEYIITTNKNNNISSNNNNNNNNAHTMLRRTERQEQTNKVTYPVSPLATIQHDVQE